MQQYQIQLKYLEDQHPEIIYQSLREMTLLHEILQVVNLPFFKKDHFAIELIVISNKWTDPRLLQDYLFSNDLQSLCFVPARCW